MQDRINIITNPNKLDKKDWETFVAEQKSGNPFQLEKYYNFFSEIEGFTPFFFAALEGDTNKPLVIIQGVIQEEKGVKGFFSRRAIIFGGPVFREKYEHIGKIVEATLKVMVKALKKKAIYIETRNLFDYSLLKNGFLKNGFTFKPHLNYLVNCESEEVVKNRISKSKLRQVKKSLKEGASVIENPTVNQVEDFYGLLQILYRQKVKKPLPHKSFFMTFLNENLGKYLLIAYRDKIIGGMMCPVFSDKAVFEWYIAGEDGKYKNIYPSVLATWTAINYAIKNNIKYFDFMGAGSPEKDYGVREFKSKFGGELQEHGRFVRINQPLLYKAGVVGVKLLKYLK